MKKAIFVIGAVIIGAVVIALLGAAMITGKGLPPLPSVGQMPTDEGAGPSEMTDETSGQAATSSAASGSDALVAPDTSVGKPPSPSSAVKAFTIAAANYSFTPGAISVKKGDTVKITLKNTGGFHDLVIDEFGTGTKRLNNGQEETVIFVADKTGTFEFYCSVGSHRQMGMKGTLTVTE